MPWTPPIPQPVRPARRPAMPPQTPSEATPTKTITWIVRAYATPVKLSTIRMSTGGMAMIRNRHSSTKALRRSRQVIGATQRDAGSELGTEQVAEEDRENRPEDHGQHAPEGEAVPTVVDDQDRDERDRGVDQSIHPDPQPTYPCLLSYRHRSTLRSMAGR